MSKIFSGIIIPSLLLFISFLFFCCGHKGKMVMPEDKFIDLMADMELAEAYSSTAGSGQNSETKRNELGKGILAAHGVTKEELDSTLAWYGRNIDEYALLFDKVDKKILEKKKKILAQSGIEDIEKTGSDLWPYEAHGMISPLGNSNGWIISIDNPDLNKGDRLQWSMHLLNPMEMKGVLGVEYEDGTSSANLVSINTRPKVEIFLQTDSSKTVKRIYGSLTVRDRKRLPLFADSINLMKLDFDSLDYSKYRTQKKYGRLLPNPFKTDTVPSLNELKDNDEKSELNP